MATTMMVVGLGSSGHSSDVGSGWSDEQQRVLAICSFVSSCFSLVGSVFIMVVFFAFFRRRRKWLTHRLVVYLSVCHFFLAVCWLVTGPIEPASATMCHFIAPARYFLELASFFWTMAIATELVRTWYRARANQFGELVVVQSSSLRREAVYHGISWCIPLLITIWPSIFVSNEIGLLQCWFEDDVWIIVFWSILILSCLYCLIIYCLALFKYKNVVIESGSYSSLQESRRKDLKLRIASYLLAFLITWLPMTIVQIMYSVSDRSEVMFVFTIISSTLVPLTGFLDSLIYGWDRKLWDSVLVRLFRVCRRLDRRKATDQLLPPAYDTGSESDSRPHRPYGGISEPSEDTIVFSDDDDSA